MKSNNITAIVIGLVVVIVAFMYFNQNAAGQTVNSQGSSVINAQADEVGIYVEVSTLADTAIDSKNQNALISEKLINDLKLIVGQENLETTNFNVYEEFDYTREGRDSKGFRTVNNIKVKTTKFDLVGNIVDEAIEDGARVSYINFELSEKRRNDLKKEALEKASQDARQKAEAAASGLGQKIGKVVSVSTDNYDYMPYRFLDAVSATESVQLKADTEILPQNLEVRANVNVVFELE